MLKFNFGDEVKSKSTSESGTILEFANKQWKIRITYSTGTTTDVWIDESELEKI